MGFITTEIYNSLDFIFLFSQSIT